ncbi:MAG: AMP-binding protein [Pseudomonadota bacterium]|nr:AMP-binding protein [Pseudomonadota bacterium]
MEHIVNGDELAEQSELQSLIDVFHYSFARFPEKKAFTNLGFSLTYQALDEASAAFGAYLQQHTSLEPGDRIAIQLPNLLQYPIACIGALRAGFVVVNTNPLYTEREMEHQFNDSEAKAIVIFAHMADKLEKILPNTQIQDVIVTHIADVLPAPKRWLVNTVVKHVKKMVPDFSLPQAVSFNDALNKGKKLTLKEAKPQAEDIAVLQYTGGTTGVAKGAMLTHNNLVSNMLQCKASMGDLIKEGQETVIAPLPVYHIYTFTVNGLFFMLTGNETVFITNPRDLPSFVKTLKETKFTGLVGLNTLFAALCNSEDFQNEVDFSGLKMTLSGGMALSQGVAHRWEAVTGCQIVEGYGMTETSPVISFNPPDDVRLGTVGRPVPGTQVCLMSEEGEMVTPSEVGELCCRGPQVMRGYWKRDDATAKTITAEGWIKTGDIATIDADGYISIVDRKKDMIIVSGFNVYPNEIEDEISLHEGILEAAAIGVEDEKTGEAVKLFVVKKDPAITENDVIEFARKNLTAYKVPKQVEFIDELPKTAVGKVLRRALRGS